MYMDKKRLQCNSYKNLKWILLSKFILKEHAENLTLYGKTMLRHIATRVNNVC